jgi:hypothetical protein
MVMPNDCAAAHARTQLRPVAYACMQQGRLTDSLTTLRALICQGRCDGGMLSAPLSSAASSEDHRGDKGAELAAHLHHDQAQLALQHVLKLDLCVNSLVLHDSRILIVM